MGAPSLLTARARGYSDGYLYSIMRYGRGVMPRYGDKIVRPMVARNGVRLGFVWVLMGCLGGFEVLGLVGLVVGPVLLALTRERWEERMRAVADAEDASSPSMAE